MLSGSWIVLFKKKIKNNHRQCELGFQHISASVLERELVLGGAADDSVEQYFSFSVLKS